VQLALPLPEPRLPVLERLPCRLIIGSPLKVAEFAITRGESPLVRARMFGPQRCKEFGMIVSKRLLLDSTTYVL
jgi:hypothetical protein